MAKQRYINTKIWEDHWFEALDPVEKLFFIYLLTNPMTNISGIYELSKTTIGRATGLEKNVVDEILQRFEKAKKVYYRDGWVVLVNFVKHQNNKSPKIMTGIKRELENIPESLVLLTNIPYVYGMYTVQHFNTNTNTNTNINYSEQSSVEFNNNLYLEEMIKNNNPHISLIGKYFSQRGINFPDKETAQMELKRWLKDAKFISKYDEKHINQAFKYVSTKFPEMWNLSTMRKYISDPIIWT